MKIKNIQIVPPFGFYFVERGSINHDHSHWVVSIFYADGSCKAKGFLSYDEAISFITEELQKLEDLENET